MTRRDERPFSQALRATADTIWQAIFDHPMVRQLGQGTLEEAPFRHWVKQDALFLIEYSRVFALGAVKAPALATMGRFATLLDETLNTEMDLHRAYAKRLGIAPHELETTEPGPATQAYTDFLVRTAAVGTFGDLVAALLPCMWGFNETGQRLAAQGRPEHEHYAAWIDMYASPEFTRLTRWCRDLMDEVAHDASEADGARWHRLFITSSRYEYLFWDAAWRQEAWPV